MLKLIIFIEVNLYKDLVEYLNVVCIVVLLGGYSREKVNELFKDNVEFIVSFLCVLVSDLRVG